MSTTSKSAAAILAFLALLPMFLSGTPARAQAPHDSSASVPLPVSDLPVGTVSVRITRPTMTEAIADADILAVWTTSDRKPHTATQKTGSDGRAIFADLPVGATFVAKATVEGEVLVTQPFVVPDKGGTRFLMIAGGGASPAMGAQAAAPAAGGPAGDGPAAPAQPVGIRSGKVEARDGIQAGRVELTVLDADGKSVPGVSVDLGYASGKSVDLVHAVTDDHGVAHFAELPADGKMPYAAVVNRDGVRIGTPTFVLESKRGAAGEIKLPGRTNSLSVLRVGASSRMLVELREEAVGLLQNLVVENTSDKVFDAGPGGLFIPLPDGFAGAEKLPGGSDIEIKENVGVYFHAPIPPGQSMDAAVQIRLGYVLPVHETRELEIVQPMPLGLQGGLVLVPAEYGIGISAPGLRARANQRDDSGNELRIFELDAVPPGQALHLTVMGLPTHGQRGKWIAGVIASLIVAAGFVAARRPGKKSSQDTGAG